MKNKFLKKTISMVLAGTMVFSMVGCGKKEKSTEEKIDIYDSTVDATIDANINNMKVIDNVLYASYYNWSDEDGKEGNEEWGMITYDFDTKEQNKAKIDIENMYINSFSLDENKNIVVEVVKSYFDESAGNGEENDFKYSDVELTYNSKLELLNQTEGEVKTISADSEELESDEMVAYTEYDNQNRMYELLVKYGTEEDEYSIKVKDESNNEIANIKVPTSTERLFRLSDGEVVCAIWGDEEIELYKINVEEGKLGEKLKATVSEYTSAIYAGLNESILISENGYLKRLDVNTGKETKVLKFTDSDILEDNIMYLSEKADGEFVAVVASSSDGKIEICRLVKRTADSIQKEEIHLAALNSNSELQEKVIEFNKKNDKYKIVLDVYYTEDGDYSSALKKLNAAISSKNAPDIIDLTSLPFKEYVEKGALESLDSYLEKDSEFSEDMFVESVVNTFKVNDKIYTIPSKFVIDGFAGATSKFGEEIKWTMKEFADYVNKLPEGTDIMEDMTSDGFLYAMLFYSMDEYIDWSTGECSFNTQDFISLLELCSNYKKMEEQDYSDITESEVSKIRNNKVLMRNIYIDSIDSYMSEKAIFGEDITIKGYPSKEDNGIVISVTGSLLGISSKSKYKDVAWEFIREQYTDEEQDASEMVGFSIRKDKLEETLNKSLDTNGLEPDADGNVYMSTWMYDDIELKIAVPTKEDVEDLLKVINAADTVADDTVNDEIYKIIEEESEGFFEGQKSVQDVVDVIQSRVSLYVKENK